MASERCGQQAVVVHDPAGRVLQRNARAAELLGLQRGDLVPGHDSLAPLDVPTPNGWRRLRPHLEEVCLPDGLTVLALVRSYEEEALIRLPERGQARMPRSMLSTSRRE